jgi:zinc protease
MSFVSVFRRGLAVALVAGASALTAVLPVRAMTIQEVTSPGGIKAWLVEEKAIPLVTMNFSFRGGSAQDPVGKEGLANLMTTLFDEGAGDLSSQAFQTKLQDLSIRISFEDGRDAMFGELRTLSENLDAAAELLTLAVTKPRFEDDAVARMRAQLIAGLRREAKDPETQAGLAFAATVFPDHPYGRPTQGTETTLAAITSADLKAAHGRLFARDTLQVAVVGDISAERLGKLLDSVFGALPAKAQLTPVAEVAPKLGERVNVAMAIPQTVIRLGTTGLKRSDPDFIPAFVMNHILGGGSFSSWLFEEVREKRGLAYSVFTALVPYDYSGLLIGGVATRADRADESLTIIKAQMERMAKDGPSAEELAKAKAFLTGSYALRFDTSGKIANQLLSLQMENLGIDYIDKRNSLIEAVTLADLRRVAQRLLSSPITVVTVGSAGG